MTTTGKRWIRIFTSLSLGFLGPHFAIANDSCSAKCLDGLRSAAYNRYGINESTYTHQAYRHAFCDALHQLKQGSSSASGDVLTQAFFAEFKSESQYYDKLDHEYCSDEAKELTASSTYAFWSEFVDDHALDVFRQCMQICNPPVGMSAGTEQVDNCNFMVNVRYTPISKSDKPPRVTNVDIANASCTNVPKPKDSINFGTGQNIKCARYGRSAAFVNINTDKGPAFASIPQIPTPPLPQPPEYKTEWSDTDASGTPYVDQQCKPSRDTWKGAPCTSCTGTCSIPGRIPDPDHVSYTCSGSGCGYSYNRAPERGYDKDILVSGGTMTWFRRWTAGDITDIYTIRYQMQTTRCVSSCDYEHQKAEYDKALLTTCPGGTHTGMVMQKVHTQEVKIVKQNK
jgi:hypothetical protein